MEPTKQEFTSRPEANVKPSASAKQQIGDVDRERRLAALMLLKKPTSSFLNTHKPPSPKVVRVDLYPEKPGKGSNHHSVEDKSIPKTTEKLQYSPINYSLMRSRVDRFGTPPPLTGGPGAYVDRVKHGLQTKDPQRQLSSFRNAGTFAIPLVPQVKEYAGAPSQSQKDYQHSSLYGTDGYSKSIANTELRRLMANESTIKSSAEFNNTLIKDLVSSKVRYSTSFRSAQPRLPSPRSETNTKLGPGAFDLTQDGKSVGVPDFHSRGSSYAHLIKLEGPKLKLSLPAEGVNDVFSNSKGFLTSQSARGPVKPTVPKLGSESRFSRSAKLSQGGPESYDGAALMMAQNT